MQQLRYSRYLKYVAVGIDLLLIVLVVMGNIGIKAVKNPFQLSIHDAARMAIILVIWILLSGQTRLYSVQRNLTFTRYLQNLFSHIILFSLIIYLLSWVTESGFLSDGGFELALKLGVMLGVVKTIVFLLLKEFRSRGGNHRNTLIIGNDKATENLAKLFQRRKDFGIKVYRIIDLETDLPQLTAYWKTYGIYSVFLPEEWLYEEHKDLLKKIFRLADENGVRVNFVPKFLENPYFDHELAYFENQPVLLRYRFPLDSMSNRWIKKAFDWTIILLFLILIGWWLIPIIMLVIYFTDGSPVFFSQPRLGKDARVFNCLKFRTMRQSNESNSKTTLPGDKRITKTGAVLRATSLDELPQIFNVLRGEMSLIGPRPHMPVVDGQYKYEIDRYEIRAMVLPGITGLAQVSGYRGEGENMAWRMEQRILADRFYVKNWTPVLDVIILLKTIKLLVFGDKNAY